MAETLQSWSLLVLTVTVIPYINGERWAVTIADRDIEASPGENVVIQCKFTYPPKDHKDDINVYWKVKDKTKNTEQGNPFIFHTDALKVKKEYVGRTTLVGEKKNGNCSLQINKMRNNESGIYVRIEANDSYSFINDMVSVTVTAGGKRVRPKVTGPNKALTHPPVVVETTSLQTTSGLTTLTEFTASPEPPSKLPLVISVPAAATVVVVIAVVTACVLYRKHSRRSQSLERTSSGYYANFSRSTMNQTKRELSSLNKGITEDARAKVTDDEPVYSNLPSSSRPPPGAMEAEENIYANM